VIKRHLRLIQIERVESFSELAIELERHSDNASLGIGDRDSLRLSFAPVRA
jgi:hypothetical protein